MTAQDPDTNRNDNIATPFVSGQFSFSDKPLLKKKLIMFVY